MGEIEFRRNKIDGRERWIPYGLSLRGTTTIEVCGLDRPGLLTLYADHGNHAVRPKLEPLQRAHEESNAKAVVKSWETAKRALLHPARELRALSHDALAVLVSAPLRARYNLQLDRLG